MSLAETTSLTQVTVFSNKSTSDIADMLVQLAQQYGDEKVAERWVNFMTGARNLRKMVLRPNKRYPQYWEDSRKTQYLLPSDFADYLAGLCPKGEYDEENKCWCENLPWDQFRETYDMVLTVKRFENNLPDWAHFRASEVKKRGDRTVNIKNTSKSLHLSFPKGTNDYQRSQIVNFLQDCLLPEVENMLQIPDHSRLRLKTCRSRNGTSEVVRMELHFDDSLDMWKREMVLYYLSRRDLHVPREEKSDRCDYFQLRASWSEVHLPRPQRN